MSIRLDPDQSRHFVDILLGLIWVQSVCKVYEQMTQEDNELINFGFYVVICNQPSTLCIQMTSSIWFDTMILGWYIVHIKGSKIRISILRSSPVSAPYFYLKARIFLSVDLQIFFFQIWGCRDEKK